MDNLDRDIDYLLEGLLDKFKKGNPQDVNNAIKTAESILKSICNSNHEVKINGNKVSCNVDVSKVSTNNPNELYWSKRSYNSVATKVKNALSKYPVKVIFSGYMSSNMQYIIGFSVVISPSHKFIFKNK